MFPYLQTASLLLGMGNLGINLLNYLNDTSQPIAPVSNGIQSPYTPLFTGGQMTGVAYQVIFKITKTNGVVGYAVMGAWTGNNLFNTPESIPIMGQSNSSNRIYGKIPSLSQPVKTSDNGSSQRWSIAGYNASIGLANDTYNAIVTIYNIRREDGLADTGGNLPNPNPVISDPDTGYQDSPYVTAPETTLVDNSTVEAIVPAAPLALVPATLSGLLALLRAAASIAELAQRIADLIEGLYSLLKTILDFLRELEKLFPRKKSVTMRELGSISKDGFLRLYPIGRSSLQAISLDLRLTSIPLWKKDMTFGSKSPNRYVGLGRILFVSETMGIISGVDLEYSINSIPIPENAIGFYYHLGLDGSVQGVTNCFYLKS